MFFQGFLLYIALPRLLDQVISPPVREVEDFSAFLTGSASGNLASYHGTTVLLTPTLRNPAIVPEH